MTWKGQGRQVKRSEEKRGDRGGEGVKKLKRDFKGRSEQYETLIEWKKVNE